MDENTIIELHSEECVCHGYGWLARRRGSNAQSACCKDKGTVPPGAVWVDSAAWLTLGLPRTAEQYYRAQKAMRNREAVAVAV